MGATLHPLTFVLSNAEWALDQLGRPGAPDDLGELLQALGDVVKGAQRMKVIVSDLRTAARDEAPSALRPPLPALCSLLSVLWPPVELLF